MSLVNILKEMEANKPNAEMDVHMGNPSTFTGRMGLKRAAIEKLKRLARDYRKELMTQSTFILVTGTGQEDFIKLASSDAFGCFSVDPDRFYRELSQRVSPPNLKQSLYGREGVKSLFNIAQNVLRDRAVELDIDSYPPLYFNNKYNVGVQTMEEFATVLKAAINDQVGAEIVGIDAIDSIVDGAIKKGHSASVTPIVLGTSDEKFASDLQKGLKKRRLPDGTFVGLTQNVFLVVAGKASKELSKTQGNVLVKNVSEETVAEVLETIRNKIL
jgi:hypothetical protein